MSMRFGRRAAGRRNARIMLNLASMIDVTFLLLAYFLVTMVVADREDRLSPGIRTVEAQDAGAASDFAPQRIEVGVIDGRPGYRLGARILRDRDGLAEALRPLPKGVGVVVEVAPNVTVGFAVAALQAAHDAGFEQVTYAAKR